MGFLVAQMGARMHYAVPRILAERGLLSRFYTDMVSTKLPLSLVRLLPPHLLPRSVRKLTRRIPQGIEDGVIKAFPFFGLRYALRCRSAESRSETTATHLWAGRTFMGLVLSHARWDNIETVYGFNSAALELLIQAKERGKRAILEQTIVPRSIERDLLNLEQSKWPDWSSGDGDDVHEQEFCEREQAEWEASDVIVCGSDFVKEGIRQCAPHVAGRCAVVPYGVDSRFEDNGTAGMTKSGGDRLNVLVAGSLGLRKGTPYVIQAARQLKKLASFKLAGTITVDESVLQNLPPNVEILGHVGNEEMSRLYSWADVFLLPSICEGSATVTYEAISMGVPVICTPNTGSVIRDGIEGYIIQVASSEAICEKLVTIHDDPTLLSLMSCQALKRSQEFSVAAYGARLLNALL